MEEVFAGNIERDALSRFQARSDSKGLRHLAGHLSAIGLSSAVLALVPFGPWLVPVMFGHGIALVFLFAPLHETIHRTAFKRRFLNDAVAWITGAVLVLPPTYFRAFHFAHHRHTQHIDNDPELGGGVPVRLRVLAWRLSGIPYWADEVRTILRHAAGRVDVPYVAANRRPAIVREARLYLGLYALGALASVLTGSWVIVLFWLAPAVFAQPVLRAYLLAEHTGLPLVPGMLRNSRSIRSNRLVRALAWNMPYHAEHHAYPGVPFHALPALSKDLEPHIEHRAQSYLAVLINIVIPRSGALAGR